MPVPRLFEVPSDQRERWMHVLACIVGLSGPETRPALIAELTSEDLPGVEDAQTREAHPLGGAGVDILVRDRDRRWVVAVQGTLGFEADASAGILAAHAALADQAERVIGVVITPDRKPSAAVASAQGAYFLTPRVAELYRLEELMPTLAPLLRPTLSSVFFDLNDISPAPHIGTGATGAAEARIGFPRTGNRAAEIVLDNGAFAVQLAEPDLGGSFASDGSSSTLAIGDPADWVRGRSGALAAARRLLPVAR